MKNLAISIGIAFFVQKGHSLGVLIVFVVLKFVGNLGWGQILKNELACNGCIIIMVFLYPGSGNWYPAYPAYPSYLAYLAYLYQQFTRLDSCMFFKCSAKMGDRRISKHWTYFSNAEVFVVQ